MVFVSCLQQISSKKRGLLPPPTAKAEVSSRNFHHLPTPSSEEWPYHLVEDDKMKRNFLQRLLHLILGPNLRVEILNCLSHQAVFKLALFGSEDSWAEAIVMLSEDKKATRYILKMMTEKHTLLPVSISCPLIIFLSSLLIIHIWLFYRN